MCGIFALLNYDNYSIDMVNTEFMKGQSRGPEFSKLETTYAKMLLGFHRLAINGLNVESNQPLVINDVVLICNGEIYNFKELYQTMGVTPNTGSDCEAIIHLYLRYGIEQTLNMLDGVFSFILYDVQNGKMYVARDPFGVRPLYYLSNNKYLYGFASELKCLEKFYNYDVENSSMVQFQPGTYSVFNMNTNDTNVWELVNANIVYFLPCFSFAWLKDAHFLKEMYSNISTYLKMAVDKRCLATERPIACLLSGGLDSSLIAALVNDFYNSNANKNSNKLETYSIGLEGSEDLKYASIVANYLGTNHTEIVVTEQEMFNAIPEVIKAIESYDTTSVRASIGNYLLGKYIRAHSDAKVIFNGDGSDELLGGYLYMNKCPDDIEFDKETRRLLKDIHLFDVLRSDKSISSHGLEPRTPFLDKNFVNFILSIPPFHRNHKHKKSIGTNDLHIREHDSIEKFVLRHSFSYQNFLDCNKRQALPDQILWRKKEAFSDGVSSHGRSLYQILQENIAVKLNSDEQTDTYTACIDTEKYYYKKIFTEAYPNCQHILPYFWMPKYTNATDPSARTLTFYTK